MKNTQLSIIKKLGISTKFILGVFVLAASIFIYTALAIPPESPYDLGEELSPACAPGDPNCTVDTPQESHAHLTNISDIIAHQGDIVYFDGSDWVDLAPGTSGQYLRTQGASANPQWASASTTMPSYQIAKDTYVPCPLGYILVPGSEKYGTSDFCVMKYEAKECTYSSATTTDCSGQTKADGSEDPAGNQWAASYPDNKPWISIEQDSDSAQAACSNVGSDFHLITNAEWMTIADNIINTPINDLDTDTLLFQLARGHSDGAPAASATSTTVADPTVSGCNLNLSLENSANVYSAASCELRGDSSFGWDNNDTGYYGTGQDWADAYNSGQEQLRTHVLSNGEVIWDLAGNVWEWTNDTISNTHMIKSSSGAPNAFWEGYFSADSDDGHVTNAQGFNIIPNISTSYTADNHGIGRIWIDSNDANPSGTTHAFQCGGNWGNTDKAGVFALMLDAAPTGNTQPSVGFRCAR